MKKNIILDVNIYFDYNNSTPILLLPSFNLDENKSKITQINLSKTFTKHKRDILIKSLNGYNINTFQEGQMLDELLNESNFVNSCFKLNFDDVRKIRNSNSSESENPNIKKNIPNILYNNFNNIVNKYQKGDLKVFGMYFGIYQYNQMLSTLESAVDYNLTNIQIIKAIYDLKNTNKEEFDNLMKDTNQNCYGFLVCKNGTCIITPRLKSRKGYHISNLYIYYSIKNKKSQVINLNKEIEEIVNGGESKKEQLIKFKNKVNQIIKQYDII
jgi:hypothetical protein